MKSLLSFPDRGPWGNPSFRGNCSGYIQRELIEHFQPKTFVDVCEGSGTSRDVCQELDITYHGFDLLTGIDITSDYIVSLIPQPADIVFSHPPYWSMIDYANILPYPIPGLREQSLSVCPTIEEFLEKSRVMLLNQREATREGGVYTTLTGDMRKDKVFRSFQADYITMMPRDELISVVIKAQHNCMSDSKSYAGKFIPIVHEYLIVWKKTKATLVQVTMAHLNEQKHQISATWRSLVRMALMRLGGKGKLADIYDIVEQEAGEKIRSNENWMAKIRQILQHHFVSVERGEWAVA